jgi:hypothetical protein
VAQLTSRRRAIAAVVSAVACLGLSLVLPGAWPPIAAAMVAATVMAVSDR